MKFGFFRKKRWQNVCRTENMHEAFSMNIRKNNLIGRVLSVGKL